MSRSGWVPLGLAYSSMVRSVMRAALAIRRGIARVLGAGRGRCRAAGIADAMEACCGVALDRRMLEPVST
jgi:hypothetical protein